MTIPWRLQHGLRKCEVCDAGAASLMSVFTEKAYIRKDPLNLVVGRDRYQVNNIFDGKMDVRPIQEILKEAEGRVGDEVNYSVTSANCEHFVTDLRYGVARSGQVDEVLFATKAAVGVLALGAFAGLCYQLVKNKDKHKK
ncbi:phospholipase A and acyltransferase 3-like [Rhincodon typus]|uniref:phospholipase A and acyltransferase 3-like n=1 Tax=Rhincodon typus TaxID=259920 RepID=UPI00202F31C5|nr:phospholipase A and acyltransferase 3-like [Rhincodon typus]XP_048450771.1 phospholipase A and acyltransferase 3-like [Rhincodon typus]XP_048450772.1 phospholipase A and acyltransferase 3-like [Rhincodon typus]XP_048450773.1 phospholipase A and acyltransferase 3-like [Rhincodon typus]XP_048450774.1 phospholipase A and acyltransferase 3-like [Rhincodon typus]XP_048450775.1 phospholipase A and acyltransferase 3-like [Rhincodon typus]